MISMQQLKRRSTLITSLLIAIHFAAVARAVAADLPLSPGPTATFATDPNAGLNAGKAVPGAAAVVDGHIIPMDEVILVCLRKYRSYVIDQMVQGFVLDRECGRRGITVSEAEIDKQIADLRRNLAPSTLEETLAQHHMTLAEVRNQFRQEIERGMLAAARVKPARMIHCREILVKYRLQSSAVPEATRNEAGALAMIKDVQDQLRQGGDFGTLAARYSETEGPGGKNDLGVLYDNMLGVQASVLEAAMALHKGDLSQPVKTDDGYHLIQALSTADDHPETENSLYQAADEACRHLQLQFLEPKIVVELIDNSKITFADDAELIAGKPLPYAAAVIDGHAIPMKDVVAKCLADYGPKTTDILVQNFVVDRECERRGVEVSAVEIDRQIDDLRKQIAPRTLDEGLKKHHTTMDGLKYDFRQQIERTKLAINQVKPASLVHARVILVTADPSGPSEPARGMKRTDAEAGALIMKIRDRLKAGESFESLAKQYSEVAGVDGAGDVGILYQGRQATDTAILNAALAMKKGDVSTEPVKTYNGYFLLQVISTGDMHGSEETAAYAKAAATCQEQKAQMLIPQVIVELIKKSKVVYYMHS
jgi:parvulin-like peptidyl-prolyl isomerase